MKRIHKILLMFMTVMLVCGGLSMTAGASLSVSGGSHSLVAGQTTTLRVTGTVTKTSTSSSSTSRSSSGISGSSGSSSSSSKSLKINSVSWSSSKSSVASVKSSGTQSATVTAKKKGSATIKATVRLSDGSTQRLSYKITVSALNTKFEKSSLTLATGDGDNVIFKNTVSGAKYSAKSSKPKVASVESVGGNFVQVKAKKAGTTTITLTTTLGSKKTTSKCRITVKDSKLSVSTTADGCYYVGDEIPWEYHGTGNIAWYVSDKNIASSKSQGQTSSSGYNNTYGLIKFKKKGTVKLYAKNKTTGKTVVSKTFKVQAKK